MTTKNPSQFEKELLKQSEALQETFEYYRNGHPGEKLLILARKLWNERDYSQIVYTGMGSSFFNSLIPYYYLNSLGFSCDVIDTGELIQYLHPSLNAPIDKKKRLVIAVSQSGESGEIVQYLSLTKAKENRSNDIWGITNSIQSTLGSQASLVFPTLGGIETSVTSKTYITGILVQYLLARAISGQEVISSDIQDTIGMVNQLLFRMFTSPNSREFTHKNQIYEHLGSLTFINFIGTGSSMATVMQSALNAKEIAKINAEGITLNQFRHGPIEAIDSHFRAILFASDELGAKSLNPVVKNITTKWGEGKVVVISNHSEIHQSIMNSNVLFIPNPIHDPYLATIFEIAIIQGYLCLLARSRGFIPGEFRNTQKITK